MLVPTDLATKIDSNILQDKGPVWQAAKNAYTASYNYDKIQDGGHNIFGGIKDLLEINSIKFADEFVSSLRKQNVSLQFSQLIDEYIKTAGFTGILTIPDPASGSMLASPSGPVTGVINLSPITTQVKII